MKLIKSNLLFIIILFALAALQACKTKKLAQNPAAQPAPVVKPTTTAETPKQAPVTKPAQVAPPAPQPPTLSFDNNNKVTIQFEFDSSVLKTSSYAILDQVASVLRTNPGIKLALKGYASIEGTPKHNMTLSQDRANAVKLYLLNSGVTATQITAKGYGTKNPVADNSTEEGREKNRRVEIGK